MCGREMTAEEVYAEIAADKAYYSSDGGVTFSGGEPLLQAEPCRELAAAAHDKGLTVWCYTGFTYEQIRDGVVDDKGLLDHVDVLVDGRFEIGKRSLDLLFRGSLNQRLIDVKRTRKTGNVCLESL